MQTEPQAGVKSIRFCQTELAAARTFLDIAQTSREETALYRNLHNAELAIDAVHRELGTRALDPRQAALIRHAADDIAGRLNRLVTR
jgi:hypothetical protein